MTGRSWSDMDPEDFGLNGPDTLFELTVDQVPSPDDGCGTGDLFDQPPDPEPPATHT